MLRPHGDDVRDWSIPLSNEMVDTGTKDGMAEHRQHE
jgi:hypothetical protein